MKIREFLLIALLAVTLLPTSGSADERRSAREHPARKMWEELNLTAEQEAKFKEINAKYAPGRRDHARIMEDIRTKINLELAKERPSRSLLAQYAGQMGEHQKKMNIASVSHLLEVKAVLTPEQFKRFSDKVPIGGTSGGRRSEEPDDD
jgi:Spy/CpxP family protein refolding chaperone